MVNFFSRPVSKWTPPVIAAAAVASILLGVSAYGEGRADAQAAAAAPKVVLANAAMNVRALEQLAQQDPMALPRLGHQRYKNNIQGYTATFTKQERIKGKLSQVQQMEVRYREKPHSVYMHWTDNADQAKRVLYVDAPEFVDGKGRKVAKVEPAGAVIRLLVSEVEIPIHGDRARETSRRGIDEFGFKSTLQLLEDYNELGKSTGKLEFRYIGQGTIDGRPTFIFERFLPYSEGGPFPDAKLVMHLDQEWLLPTAVHAYSDREGRTLLGSYVFSNVKLNPPLTDADFKF